MSVIQSRLEELSNVANNELFALIQGSGSYSTDLPRFCNKVTSVLEEFLDPSIGIDLGDEKSLYFLKNTLPALTEAFLRRITQREHVSLIVKMLIMIAKLLAKPAAQDIVELCELRNYLLIGVVPPQLKFINPRQFTSYHDLAAHLSNEGFFGEFGVPVVAYMGQKMLTFWPDEWQKAVGGIKAVGHFVEWYHIGSIDDLLPVEDGNDKIKHPSVKHSSVATAAATEEPGKSLDLESAAETQGMWLTGRVVGFKRDTQEYFIQVEPVVKPRVASESQRRLAEYNGAPESFAASYLSEGAQQSTPLPSPVPVETFTLPELARVNLTKVMHRWVDAEHRNRIPLHPTPSAGLLSRSAAHGDALLAFSASDVGQFIRLWWSRYHKYYYGRIVRYDAVNKLHSVTYEDGDSRPYDMTSKDYDLIFPPAEVLSSGRAAVLSDIEASKIVANWHRALHDTLTSPRIISGENEAPFQFTHVVRPAAATALSMSLYQLAVLDEYFREGGFDAVFQSLTEASQPAPVSRIILLHLQLAFHLRPVIGADRFKELVWDLKEAVPGALFRYEDAQIKELTAKSLNDVLVLLRDLMLLVVTGSQYVPSPGIKESIEEIRLTFGSSLLVCSQLQKRYLGLSMIKETLDLLLPKLENYMVRRYNAIGVPRSVKSPTRPVSAAAGNSRITTAFMDRWLVETGVVESLFGESLHQDLVARSDCVLIYMASRKVLTERHLDLIWNASLGVHEAVVRVLHQLILLIVPVLGAPLRNYLFSLMSALPCKEYTEQILLLIKAYTVQALVSVKDEEKTAAANANKGGASSSSSATTGTGAETGRKGQVLVATQRQWMGFSVLWQFVQDPVAISDPSVSVGAAGKAGTGTGRDVIDEGLIDLAVQLLVELLQEEFKDERELVMQRCLDNINAGRSVPVSLQILRRTLALYPQAPKSWFVLGRPSGPKVPTVGSQIEKLIKNSQLLETLFRDLDSYHRSIVAAEKVDEAVTGVKKSRSGANLDSKQVSKAAGRLTPVSSAANISAGALQIQIGTGRPPSVVSTGRVSQLKGVSERLDFLRFIISWSSVKLSEAQTMLLWNAFGAGANTVETLEKLVVWFNSLINKESKPLCVLLSSLAHESDPTETEQRSKLAFLSPQVLTLSQQKGYSFQSNAAVANALALLSSAAETHNASGNSFGTGTGTANGAGGGGETFAIFEEGVLVKLFEQHIAKWAFQFEKVDVLSRLLTANLCFKLFLHTNICNRSIKVEGDGSWIRVGPLSGLPLLWRIALDATDVQVAQVAIALLIELHHKTGSGKTPKAGETYKANLLRTCFMHLYLSMQSLHRDDSDASTALSVGDTSIAGDTTSGASLDRKPASSGGAEVPVQDDMFHDNNALMKPAVIASRIKRLIVTLRLAIQRFYIAPSPLSTVRVLTGREETPALTVVLRGTDRIGRLRLKIAEHFKESVECIQLFRTGKSSSLIGIGGTNQQEFLDRDELTLQQTKFGSLETITAQKKDAPAGEIGIPVGSTVSQQSQKYSGTSELKDLFSSQDLSVNLLQPLNPLLWVSSVEQSMSSNTDIANIAAEIGTGGSELFVMPPFPLISVIESKLAAADLVQTAESMLHAPKSAAGRDSPVPVLSSTAEKKARVLEFLAPIVRASPFYIDQLIEVLDGYLAAAEQGSGGGNGTTAAGTVLGQDGNTDLSAAVWDILLSLPTHAPLTQQLRDIVTTSDGTTAQLSQLLSVNCPYRLLYSLRILETFLCTTPTPSQSTTPRANVATAAVQDWTVKFFQMGGAEYILQLLETFLAKESSRTAEHSGSAMIGMKSKSVAEGMPRCDVNAMIIALLSRVMYHLLMADPLFSNWQSAPGGSTSLASLSAQDSADTVPAGVILCAVDVAALAEQIMGCTLHCAGLWKAGQLSEAALKAMCENVMLLLFGLLTAVDTGHSILSSTGTCQTWLSTMCVRCSSAPVRQAACRRVFEVSASIFHKCADPTVMQEEKRGRLRLYDFLYQNVVTAVDCLSSGAYNERVKHGEQVYSLLAALEALRNSPFLIFPQLSSERTMRSSTNTLKSVDSPRGVPVSPSSPRVISPDQPEHQHALIEIFATKLVQHVSSESFHSTQPDGTLVGILRVLLVFANSGYEQRRVLGSIEVTELKVRLIPYLYCNCLFPSMISVGSVDTTDGEAVSSPVEANTEAVCQTVSSRKLVYALLYRLCESTTENLAQLVEVMGSDVLTASAQKTAADLAGGTEQSVELALPRLPVWNYDPGTLVKEPGAYVGLCNQGGTCYMNSFVQQLFHIPAFHEGLLRINAKTADEGEQRDENAQLLFQLQVMFGFMKFSQKRYYDTVPFCRAFIDYDGQPVSMSEQKDINEFAGMLFDKLEHNKEAASLLANTIQGKIVYRTRSIETSYRSEREENFYMLTAEVKDKATLEDSLELFTTEELFSGDNKIEDSETGRKVDALRGCAIRTLPSTLIIHLKRFEFDLETMNRKKVNDHIAFPTELDMLPYTEEGLQEKEDQAHGDRLLGDAAASIAGDSDGEERSTASPTAAYAEPQRKERRPAGYYQYALKGVVAHVGAIDRGHYYSFIRDPEKTGSGSWLEFNDRSVLPFNPEAIPAECFGGKDEYVNTNGVACTRVRENSAYILVYERIGECHELHNQEARSRLSSAESVDETNLSLRRSLRSLSIDETTPRHTISKPVMKAVSKENAEFQRDRFLFHPLHFAFAWQLQQMQAVTTLLTPTGALKPGHNALEKIVYRDAEPEQVTLSLVQPNSSVVEPSRSVDVTQTALSHLVLASMRFIIEVLVRARAQNCIHLFIERLEEVVMLDRTGGCALALLKVFASEGTGAPPVVPSEQDLANAASVSGSYTSRARSRISTDLEQVEQTCHRWLTQMVVFCPHPQTVKAFLRLLLNCVKVVKSAQEAEAVSGLSNVLSERLRDSLPDSAAAKSSSSGITYPIGPVVDLAEKLLFIAERPQLDYLGCKESFDLKCMFLYQLAGLGIEEKRLLVKLGGIPRMCCAVMALFPTAIKTNENKLQFATDLVARLILSSRLSPTGKANSSSSNTSSSSSPRHSHSAHVQMACPGPRVVLQTLDTATFLSRTYLEEAVILNASSATAALQQVYMLVPDEERAAVLDFLAEKVLEALNTPSLPTQAYRPFFRVLSELLQGSALPSIFLHQTTIAKIVTKAQQLSGRSSCLDHEVVFEVCRLLQTLGTASADAHAVVMQLRDSWKSLAGRLASAKRCATITVANAESNAATSAHPTGARNGKVATTSSAFLMN